MESAVTAMVSVVSFKEVGKTDGDLSPADHHTSAVSKTRGLWALYKAFQEGRESIMSQA